MPYNNTPIAPSQEVSGQVALPLARVQKIINADAERAHVSKNASFAIAFATELFIQHLAEASHRVVKAERKPRRNIQYRDVATAVAKTDNLEFLVDVVPKTVTYKDFKKKQEATSKLKAEEKSAQPKINGPSGLGANAHVANGEKNGGVGKGESMEPEEVEEPNGDGDVEGTEEPEDVEPAEENEENRNESTPEIMDIDDSQATESEAEEDGAERQIEMEMRGPPRANGSSPIVTRRTSGFTAINGGK